jgi:hypothetical protein
LVECKSMVSNYPYNKQSIYMSLGVDFLQVGEMVPNAKKKVYLLNILRYRSVFRVWIETCVARAH